jgi:hypothetical protein
MSALTELERAVYEAPDGRHCVLVIVVGAFGDGAGRRDLARGRAVDEVQVCYLVDGSIPAVSHMEFGYHRQDDLRRCGELIDARTEAR